MVDGPNPAGEADKAACYGVADPDAEPGLPPRQASHNHTR